MRIALAVLALTTLALGCIIGGCDEPMVEVYGRCCLDGDRNSVCDDLEGGAAAECQPPYILYNGQCCPDMNGNRVCDGMEDMGGAETPTTIAPVRATIVTASSTTTMQTTSSSSPASTSTLATTSTSLRAAPSTLKAPPCVDSDNGENPDVAGWVTGKGRVPPHGTVTEYDFCVTNQSVHEYRCDGELVYGKETLCRSDKLCVMGRCCLPQGAKCGAASECCGNVCRKRMSFSICY